MCQIGAIADYLIANGVIVPPCKVGDTVYELDVYAFNGDCGDCKHFDCGGFGDSPSCMKTINGLKHPECIKINPLIVTKDVIRSILYS